MEPRRSAVTLSLTVLLAACRQHLIPSQQANRLMCLLGLVRSDLITLSTAASKSWQLYSVDPIHRDAFDVYEPLCQPCGNLSSEFHRVT